MSRNGFGTIRQLASGRYQARYIGPDGIRRTAPMTFDTKTAARRWLSMCETDILRGTWVDVEASAEVFSSFAERWISERRLAERSVVFYRDLLRLHIAPHLGSKELRQITPALVRAWHQGLLAASVGPSTVAKAYRLLRAVLNTAVDDELIMRNPCRIKGAGVEHPEERPVLTVAQVRELTEVIEPRYRALVLLAVYASLRWGELMGLQRNDFDLEAGVVSIRRSVTEYYGRQIVKDPKTRAGRRVVAFPMWLVPEIEHHLATYAASGPEGALFVTGTGARLLRSNFSGIWADALRKAGLTGIRVHDLRHTGNHFAALTGASTRELMGRMGHSSVNAALVYQHRTRERDRAIADALEGLSEGKPGHGVGHVRGTRPDSASEEVDRDAGETSSDNE